MTKRRLALGFAAWVAAWAAPPADADLRLHPDNPRYFIETSTGKAVLITAFTSTVPTDATWDPVASFRQEVQSRRVMYSRVWHFLPWSMDNAIWPWADSNVGGAYRGGTGGFKLDLNVWNNTYWTRMRDAMGRASGAGIYEEIMLFDGVGLMPAEDGRWGNNPWAADNNINNLEVPNAAPPNDGTPEFYGYATRPNLRTHQENYIRKMIDETIQYSTMIYEIENEHRDNNDPDFGTHYAQFVRNYITATYPTTPRLVSYSSIDPDLEAFYTVPECDIVSWHPGAHDPTSLNNYLETRWGFNKAINVDEFANNEGDPNALRLACWTIIASGAHFHIEDALASAQPYEIIENIRAFKSLSDWDFAHASPDRSLVTAGGGYCMAQNGVEYMCYFPAGGAKNVNLAAATYRTAWWNPRTGGFSGTASITHGGGNRTFNTPDGLDWVLLATTRAEPATALQSKPAGFMTIDGDPADWALTDFTTPIHAGSTGTGDTAIVGYGGHENWTCYKGGHYSPAQFPPTDALDYAVRIYSRHDASALYFLVRFDDSQIQTPNPQGANWANDCIEFYIDPGHDHGAARMANAASDLQLVIDAANQKNVYETTAGYATQVLAGVFSAVRTDATGWWLEVKIDKAVLDPDVPASSGTIGIEFNCHDNDAGNIDAQSSTLTWRDPEVSNAFPTKIPDRWGDLSLQAGGGGGNQAPVVTLTSPAGGASQPAPASFNLAATASDPDGTVAVVEFYAGATLIGQDTTAGDGFTATWNNVAAGSYTITAVARDNAGAATTSAGVSVTVTGAGGNQLPTVTLTSPANGATASAPGSFNLAATASDADGTIARVEFLQNGTLISQDTTPGDGFTGTWSGVTAGSYTVTARAVDSAGGATTSAAATVTVTAAGPVPWNQLGTTVDVVGGSTPGIACDAQGNVHIVYAAGGLIYYQKAGTNLQFGAAEQITAPEGPGPYNSFDVKVDANGVPHVVFEKDMSGGSVSGWYTNRIGGSWKAPLLALIGNPNNGDRVNYPRLWLHGNFVFASSFGGGPGGDNESGQCVRIINLSTTPAVDRQVNTLLWVPHVMVNASNTVFLVGRKGAAGHYIQVYDLDLNFTGEYEISNGKPSKTGEQTAATMDANGIIHAAGYILPQTWYNNSAREVLGQGVILGLDNPPGDGGDLDIYHVLAADDQLRIYLSYKDGATDEGRITVINNGAYDTPVTFATNVETYLRWNPQLAPAPGGGVYAAWESAGRVFVRSIGVNPGGGGANQSPTATLTSPTSGQTFTAPATITLMAGASDADGTVARVEFYQGSTLIGQDTTAADGFTLNWSNVAAGSYSLTARAVDSAAAATTSAAVSITVNSPGGGGANQPPTVSLTAPAAGATFTAPSGINLTATAADADGAIVRVEFFAGATLLGESTAAPYAFNWTGVSAGSYSLTARATDNQAAVTTSNSVSITVNSGTGTGADTDGDGLPDSWENQYFGNLNQNGSGDPDADGLLNQGEFTRGTNPMLADTDADGMPDGGEVTFGLSPVAADQDGNGQADGLGDWDGDGVNNQTEVANNTSPGAVPVPAAAGGGGGGGGGGCFVRAARR